MTDTSTEIYADLRSKLYPPYIDLIGQQFGRLLVEKMFRKNNRIFCQCLCRCGQLRDVNSYDLKSGKTKSCGCLQKERSKKANTKHGLKETRIYRIWTGIRTRCTNTNSRSFCRYGGRGIKLCDRWYKFENFWEDMKNGYRDDLTIERIDNSTDYCKENCRWATRAEQARNTRRNIVYKGICAMDASKILGGGKSLIKTRLRDGWDIEKAFTTPNTHLPND